MKKLRRNKRGFTLVELIVVIAILAILASTATVATIAILNNARKSPVEAEAGQVKSMYGTYQMESTYADSVDGFKKFLEDTMPDLKNKTPDNKARIITTSASEGYTSGDTTCYAIPNNTKCKSASWKLTIFNHYFKCEVTIDGTTGAVTPGETVKW